MTGSSQVEWILKLVDRVSAPAQRVEKQLGLVERILGRIDRAAMVSGGGFGGMADKAERAASRTAKAWERTNSVISNTRQRLQGAATAALGIGASLYGAGLLGKSIVDAGAYKQDQLTSLSAMLGSRQKGAALFAKAQAFAAATPFSTQQVLDATKQAVGSGFTDRQAIPLVKLAGSLASGNNMPLDQAMLAFQALRGGDFGQAFGVGQGFSNFNINREQLVKAGLKFDKQGSYQGTVSQGLAAVRQIIQQRYGNSMDEQSKNLSGLGSTLASRPQDLFMSLVDGNGNSKALAPVQQLMSNLADLTDFSKPPGSRIQSRFESSVTKLFGALFNPLVGATGGTTGEKLINSLLDRLDAFSTWWAQYGPGILSNAQAFGSGLVSIFGVIKTAASPFMWLIDKLAILGGSGSGGFAHLVGQIAGLALAWRALNVLTGGSAGGLMGGLGSLIFGKKDSGGGSSGGKDAASTDSSSSGGLVGSIADALGKAGMEKQGEWLGAIGAAASGDFSQLGTLVGGTILEKTETLRKKISLASKRAWRLYRSGAGLDVAWKSASRILGLGGQAAASAAGQAAGAVAANAASGAVAGAGGTAAAGVAGGAAAAGAAGTMVSRTKGFLGKLLGPVKALGGVMGAALLSPVGLAVAGVATVAAVGVLAYNNWKPFHDLVDQTWSNIKQGAGIAGNWFGTQWANFSNMVNGADNTVNTWGGGVQRSLGLNTVAANTMQNTSAAALTTVAQNLGIDPQALLAVAYKESGLDPSKVNKDPKSRAAGLLQFLPSTAAEYGLPEGTMQRMTAAQQIPYIQRYLTDHGVRSGMGLEQIYSAVFGGNASRAGSVLYRAGSDGYDHNKGLDTNGDGQITSAEAAQAALSAFQQAGLKFNQTIVLAGPVTPEGINDIGRITQESVLAAQASQNTEAGGGARR
ncbi:transglycosylase SLT domain-containing protein [Deinococcus ruber]|uniref:Transglycosylase SLT domain-containing protein n=1 Tax=Deinococcus ruber TaxID=1848197 RepID=A0A918F4E6_9DEIO|nr:transglycosylase SLT domain-containing protein [Deinococcus ruber]GGR00312.1 hypothetical protein GCM10008957_11350 [Deinococcus ruber]